MGLTERELELVKSTWAEIAKDKPAAGLAIFKQWVFLEHLFFSWLLIFIFHYHINHHHL